MLHLVKCGLTRAAVSSESDASATPWTGLRLGPGLGVLGVRGQRSRRSSLRSRRSSRRSCRRLTPWDTTAAVPTTAAVRATGAPMTPRRAAWAWSCSGMSFSSAGVGWFQGCPRVWLGAGSVCGHELGSGASWWLKRNGAAAGVRHPDQHTRGVAAPGGGEGTTSSSASSSASSCRRPAARRAVEVVDLQGFDAATASFRRMTRSSTRTSPASTSLAISAAISPVKFEVAGGVSTTT